MTYKIRPPLFVLCLFLGLALSAKSETVSLGAEGQSFDLEFVTIGDPRNPPDTLLGLERGRVDHAYRIAKFEISREMFDVANTLGELELTLSDERFEDEQVPFITPRMPATGMSWREAARFTNWLNISQGYPPAYRFASHPGDADYVPEQLLEQWEVGSPEFNPANPTRNRLARFFLPSADEWYKAAFYDPEAGRYWRFTNGMIEPPLPVASGTEPGTEVFDQAFPALPAEIDQAGGLTPYGVMAMGANVSRFIAAFVATVVVLAARLFARLWQ